VSARRPALRVAALLAGAAAALFAGGAWWLLFTAGGARFAVARAQGLLAPRLTVAAVEGTLAGPLRVQDLRWNDPETGVDLRLARGEIDLVLRSLLTGTVRARSVRAQGLLLALSQAPPRAKPPPDRAPLDPPVNLVVDRLALDDARVLQEGVEVVNVRTARLAGRWTNVALRVERLDVQATQGEVHFAGIVAGSATQADRYLGQGEGRFRWRFGEREVVGTLATHASGAAADLTLATTAPARATLQVQLRQQAPWPWTWRLDVPAFDPREKLLPGSSLQRLGAQLQGNGTLEQATLRGTVLLDATTLELRSLDARREPEGVALDGELAFGGGRLHLDGHLRTAADPLDGRFTVDWRGIAIPADLVGQELRTAGRVEVSGSTAAYTAQGTLQLGPPGRLADIQILLSGDPRSVQLARFDVVQPDGRLAVAGRIGFDPTITWTLAASARRFDPGEILREWPGRLDFRLATDGAMQDGNPAGTFALQDLGGTLRQRRLAGRADLRLAADRTVSGQAQLSSGASRLSLTASRDPARGEAVDAIVDIDSLGDWLPGAEGGLRGRVHAAGRWPDLGIETRLAASKLAFDGQTIGAATLTARISRPLEPSGTAQLEASELLVGGFAFDTLRLSADGSAAAHRASFDATGPRATVGADVAGAFDAKQGRWAGTLSRLRLAAPDVANLALEAPAPVAWSAERASLGQACLADGDIRICLQADTGPAPAMHARYSVHALPLGLAQAFAPLPLTVEGALDGEGDFSRDATGAVAGQAHLRSASGRIAEPASRDETPRELLAWRDLAADASLAGDAARMTLRTALNQDGSLTARGSASGLTGPDPQVEGEVQARVPGLGVVEAFVPQLLNVQGVLALQARVAGSLDAPRVDGEARLEDLGFDLPELGLKPREGRFVARLAGDGPVQLEGSIKSGEGELGVRGQSTLTGEATLRVTGTRVLAADIPGVKVVVTPELTVQRATGRTDLGGRITIPTADINLQRLPSARRTRSASPDVVVVDDPRRAEAVRSAPLYAQVDLQLGDAVKISGYGLDAAVTGQLGVRERPGEPTTASGELRVSGRYQAYGQDLTIQQGQLLFASTPLDNPRLAITAVREVDTVTAGFRVAGSARNPELTVFSDPAMGQSNALSYIIAGKPLDQIGAGTGEGDALQSAARQLGAAAGGLLAKNVGKRLGVDELGIKDSASIGGAALTVGQYLSPRLYLGYGIGLFDPGQVVTLRYKVSRSLAIEAEQGTLNSRAGIEFRKEK
jgi:translocation and assembly module TamB